MRYISPTSPLDPLVTVAILNPLLNFVNVLIVEVIVVVVGVLEEHGSGSLFQISTNPLTPSLRGTRLANIIISIIVVPIKIITISQIKVDVARIV